jgi:hypothetical protein
VVSANAYAAPTVEVVRKWKYDDSGVRTIAEITTKSDESTAVLDELLVPNQQEQAQANARLEQQRVYLTDQRQKLKNRLDALENRKARPDVPSIAIDLEIESLQEELNRINDQEQRLRGPLKFPMVVPRSLPAPSPRNQFRSVPSPSFEPGLLFQGK